MADPFLAGNGVPCPVCGGAGWVENTGRHRAPRLPCPGGCLAGRLALPPEEIVRRQLVEARERNAERIG